MCLRNSLLQVQSARGGGIRERSREARDRLYKQANGD